MIWLEGFGTFILAIAGLAGLLWVLALWIGDARENERHKRAEVRQCTECGYDLSKSGDVCPECGALQPYCIHCGNRVFRDNDAHCPRCGREARFMHPELAGHVAHTH